ncbi:DivIVA domain-containing protein [Glycomyces albidus]|uniref:DivIVA domain-containing protein n=1 Tax=Glycomyces albidus TaxID=2656774 RepID=UPI002AD1DD36|nr:DivIVA domain-containing protein [Glycomyces albidus]
MASHGDRFRRRALSRGYKVDEVDAFLDRVEATLAGEPVGSPVSADEVDDVVFRVRFGGYDEWQVDVYLDRVARQLAELEERGVLGTAPAPDYGKPEAAASAPVGGRGFDEPPMQPGPGARRAPETQATQVIPAHDMMAAREMAPPPPAPEPVGRGRGPAARAAAAPPDNEGFGDLRGDDDEGFGFLAGPPGDDYDDPFAKRGGGQDFGAPRQQGRGDFGGPRDDFGGPPQDQFGPPQDQFGPPRDDFGPADFGPGQGGPADFGRDEFAPQRAANGANGYGPRGGAPEPGVYGGSEYGGPRGPEPVRGDFAPPAPAGPRAGGPVHDGPQAGPVPHGATEQLPLQSDPRRGGFGPADQPGVYGQGPRRGAPEPPPPGFGAAYDDEFSDTGSRRAAPPHQSPMQQNPMGQPPHQTGAIPRADRYGQPEPEPMPPAAPTQAIPQNLVPGMGGQPGGPMGRPEPPQPEPYGAPRGREYGQGGFGGPGPQEDTGYGRRPGVPSPPMQGGFDRGPHEPTGGFDRGPQHEPTGGFGGHGGAPAGPPPGQDPTGGFGGPAGPGPRGAATPPDFGRRNPYEGRGAFEAPGRHGREEMTTEMRASDSPFTPDDVQRLEQLRRAFQPRRFGSGYDPSQVDQMFDAVSAAMTGRNPVPLSDRELDTSQFSLVQGGYFEAEVDSALREVREMFARRGMMH